MRKYKVGDTVYIRRDLTIQNYGLPGVVIDMLIYRGCKATIVDITWHSSYYKLSCDNRQWSWDDNMLEDMKEVRRKKLNKLYEV